jgi:hypothetical protein
VRSSNSGRLRTSLVIAMLCAAPGVHAQESAAPISETDIADALAKVRNDPDLAPERKVRSLKWVEKDKEQQRPRDMSWLNWLGDLFAWLAQHGRFLFWAVLAFLVGLVVVYLWRLIQSYRMPERARRVDVPSFVRDLDIRPESLPDDIGAAAHQLWDSGEHRAALALLYRGLLSRLVHVYTVPIRDSSTEGDCLQLASKHLTGEDRKIFVTSLVRVWQRAVYGGEEIPTESVHSLCNEFSRALDEPAAAEASA